MHHILPVSNIDIFQNFTITSNAAMNTLGCSILLSFEVYFQSKFLVVGLLVQKVNAYIVSLDIAKFLSIMVISLCTSVSHVCECLFLHSLSNSVMLCNFSQSDWWEIVYQCSFNLHLLYYKWGQTSFHMFTDHFMSSLWIVWSRILSIFLLGVWSSFPLKFKSGEFLRACSLPDCGEWKFQCLLLKICASAASAWVRNLPSVGSLLEPLTLGNTPDLLKQNLHFDKIPRWCLCILKLGKPWSQWSLKDLIFHLH